MHFIDQFSKKVADYNPIAGATFEQTTSFANWLKDDGLSIFVQAYEEETGKKLPSPPDEKLIEQGYPKGINEFKKKFQQHCYFDANARIFVDTCKWVSENVAKAHLDHRAEPFASRHHSLMYKLVLDAQYLLSEWADLKESVPGMYGIGKNPLHCAFQITHATEQLMFAGSPFFAFQDNATDSGAALLRVAIETRLRFGFGLLGVQDINTGTVAPLNLSKVLDAIVAHESSVHLAIPIQHVSRIYGWSNIYVHIGLKHYTWSPIFALNYLNPLLRGGKYPGGISIDAGIQANRATLLTIQNEAESAYNLDPTREQLMKLEPEQCSAIILS